MDVGFEVMTVVGLVVGFVVGFVVGMEVAMDVAVDAFMVEVAALALDVEIGAVVDAGCDDEGIALEADETMLAEVDTDLVVAAVVADDESLFVVLACVIPVDD